jgi:hypothetical protein
LLIISIAPDVPETHGNLKTILNMLGINQLGLMHTYAVDLKLANILGGIQAHGSSYPCIWCEAPKIDFSDENKSHTYALRSFGSIRRNYDNYQKALSLNTKKTFPNQYKCCSHEPLLSGSDQDILINTLPPPELHLLLRITNRLLKALQESDANSAKQWLDQIGIQVPKLHSGELNGNMCRALLRKTQVLVEIFASNNQMHLLIYVKAFEAFNAVVHDCFGDTLYPSFKESIHDFSTAFHKLNIPTTTAVHVLQVHVPQFCDFTNESLGIFSEQASEAVHSDCCQLWYQCGKVSRNHKNYGPNLLSTVIRYNGRHICSTFLRNVLLHGCFYL